MSLEIFDHLQRSPEWHAARCGMVTASVVGQLVTVRAPDASAVDCPTCGTIAGTPCFAVGRKIRTEIKSFHDARIAAASNLPPVYVPTMNDGLINFLAAERIANHVEDTYTSRDMDRGIMAEPFARDLYSEHYGQATEAGFMVRTFDGFKLGYSPDGLVGDDGLIEIKSPRQKGHVTAVVAGEVPTEHMAQCQTGLLVSRRAWCDYVPYNGGLPLWRKRVTPDPAWQTAIVAAAEQAEKAIVKTIATYQAAVVGCPTTERINFDLEVF